ncbi:hypothetical protein [Streptomyces sp. SGAir0957]
MNALTVTAHLSTNTEFVIRVFDGSEHQWQDPFISLRVGDGDMDIVFFADHTAVAGLRTLARAANEAADTLDQLTARTPDGAR